MDTSFWQRPVKHFYVAILVGRNLTIGCKLKFERLCLPKSIQFCYPLWIIVKTLYFLDRLFFFSHLPSMLLPPFLSMQLGQISSMIDLFCFKNHIWDGKSSWEKSLILLNSRRKNIVLIVFEFIEG